VTKEDEYRDNAAEAMQLAQRSSSTVAKARLVLLAEAWFELAQRARDAVRRLGRAKNSPAASNVLDE
jgi:hypothetical protein